MAHILIADDIAISRETLARVLRDAGHRVTQVTSGQEAVERCRLERPEFAVLDLNMPKMGGMQAAPVIKGEHQDPFLPVFIVSGRSLSGAEIAEVLAVADDFIRKPYTPLELCARIDVWLRTRRLFEERRPVAPRPQTPAPSPKPSLGPKPSLSGSSSGFLRQPSRAAIMERLTEEWRRATRQSEPFSLLLCEMIDGGAAPEGPQQGAADDTLLQAWLSRLTEALAPIHKQAQILGASTSTRLAILFPGTHPAEALQAAEQLRARLKALYDEGSAPRPPPLALGMALFPGRDISNADDLHHCARVALQRALREGPFCLCVYQHQSYLLSEP